MFQLLDALLLINIIRQFAYGEFAFLGRQPISINPTLYNSSIDPIIQLDDLTFNDTIFCKHSSSDVVCTAYVVEFYADWCGHCRAYAEIYKSLARDIQGWKNVIQIASVNCADPLNEITCQANNVAFFPFIKYFPRNSSNPEHGILLRPLQSASEMRELITQIILQDYSKNRSPDWPNFDFLPDYNINQSRISPKFDLLQNIRSYEALWENVNQSVILLVIIFEENAESYIGAELLLDMTKYSNFLAARRCLKDHSLSDILNVRNFPTMAIFKRRHLKPLLVAELRRLLSDELERFLKSRDSENEIERNIIQNVSLCERDIIKCRQKFFVSETDMLKAMRYAIFDEVIRSDKYLAGDNITAIRNFLDILAKNFPTATIYYNITDENKELPNSKRAVKLFSKMRDYLDGRGLKKAIPMKEYKERFLNLEEENGHPFPVHSNWEHCAGSLPQFRGYTCALWTTFHSLTVHAYKNAFNDSKFDPIVPLVKIRNWVTQFFGCQQCREHFLQMTTQSFPIENQVYRKEDTFMYLWQAHNIVNARLHGEDTEDPEFPKRQFPADFLCSTCQSEGYFDNNQVKDFLLVYYSAIKPASNKKY